MAIQMLGDQVLVAAAPKEEKNRRWNYSISRC